MLLMCKLSFEFILADKIIASQTNNSKREEMASSHLSHSTSHSHLFHEHQHQYHLSNSLSPCPFLQFTPAPFLRRPNSLTHPLKLTSFSSPSRPQVFIQEPILQDSETPSQNPSKTPKSETPKKISTLSKNSVWVNPKSPRASELLKTTHDARYTYFSKLAKSLNSCDPTVESVSEVLINGIGETPLERDAVMVLNNMENPETALLALEFFQEKVKRRNEVVLYNVTFKVFRKSKSYDRVEPLFDEMIKRGVTPNNITFSTIISCARMCDLPHKAVAWFEKMSDFGISPDAVTYSAMIDAYGRSGNVDMALSLYDQARTEKWKIDVVAFGTLIRVYSMSGNYDGATNVFEEMKALGVKPNLIVYNTMMDGMGRAKRPWQVKSLHKEMIKNGISPSWGTYAALIHAYSKARYGEDALLVYRAMKEKGLEMNIILYNTMLAMCADIGFTDEAIEIFEDLNKSGTCKADSWTYSSMITMYSCSGKVSEAESMFNDMLEAGYEATIFVFTSLLQCYGKENRSDDVVRTFNRLLELGITPDEQLCACLLNVMTQTSREEIRKVVECIERADMNLASLVKMLVEEEPVGRVFIEKANEIFSVTSRDARKAYCNCLIDLCVSLNLLERACELLDLGLTLGIYKGIQSKSVNQWSLNVKSLSLGAALTALHVWMSDLSKTLENGDQLPSVLGINTGHGKHKYTDKGLAVVFESHLKELDAPFHESTDKAGWFYTTDVAAKSWLELRKSATFVSV